MKVWILTSGFGNGHASAAKALEEEYRQKGHIVVVSDIVRLLHPKQAKTIYTVFSRCICKIGWIYNLANRVGRKTYHEPKTPKALRKELERIQPDLIITTWSGCGRKLGKLDVPVCVCVTDVGVHAGWVYPYAAAYFVAADDTKERLAGFGVPAEQIHVRGIPVKSAFHRLPDKPEAEPSAEKRLLIMGGGLGIIPWLDGLLQAMEHMPNVKITVIAGKNQNLCRKLKQEYPFVEAVGFVNNVPEYLAKNDFLISKPGGVSLFESIYATTPCIAMCPIYEHELENAAFIEKYEIGTVVWKETSAYEQIAELLADEQRCRRYQMNVARKKHEIELSRVENEGVEYWNAI